MTAQDKDRIECAIRHIQTAVDIDPWAVEIAVDAMERQDAKIIPIRNGEEFATCPNCGHDLMYHREGFCEWCGQKYEMLLQEDGGRVMTNKEKMIRILCDVLDGCPLLYPCDKLWSPEGWCKDHCKAGQQEPDAECWLKYAEVMTDSRDKDKKISLEDAEYAIEQLPFAQPEIIRCKDCKWWSNDDYRECSNPNYDDGYVTPAGFYCGYAERRTDEQN